MSVVIERIPKEAIPKSLLLLADPSERQIATYVQRGLTYVAKQGKRYRCICSFGNKAKDDGNHEYCGCRVFARKRDWEEAIKACCRNC